MSNFNAHGLSSKRSSARYMTGNFLFLQSATPSNSWLEAALPLHFRRRHFPLGILPQVNGLTRESEADLFLIKSPLQFQVQRLDASQVFFNIGRVPPVHHHDVQGGTVEFVEA